MAYTAEIAYNTRNAIKEGIDYFLLASLYEVKATITNGVVTITLPNGDPITSSPFVKIASPTESSFYRDKLHTNNNGSFYYEHLVSIRLSKEQSVPQPVKKMFGERIMIIAVGFDGIGHVLGHTHGCEISNSIIQSSDHGAELNFRALECESNAEINDSNLSLLNT